MTWVPFKARRDLPLLLWALLTALLLLMPLSAHGDDTQVNTFTTGNQRLPDVAIDADGDFVVTWDSAAQDGDGAGVFAQRFNSSGVAVAAEFQVNSYTVDQQYYSSVGMADNGAFVVTWTSYDDQDGNGYGVFARRFDSSGVALAAEFQVNTYTTGYQSDAMVTLDGDGDFIVVWASAQTNLGDTSGYSTVARLYNSSGVAMGTEFLVNSYVTNAQDHAWVEWLTDGSFVVAWRSAQDGDDAGIFARRFDSAGSRLGSEFMVNTATVGLQGNAAVGALPGGGFVVAWGDFGVNDGDIVARRFNSSGASLATAFQVNDYVTASQIRPQLSSNSTGEFVVTWSSYEQDGTPFETGVFAKRYDSAGAAIGAEFMVNAFTTGVQSRQTVAMSDDGSYVIAWDDAGRDGGVRGIFADFTEGPTPTVTPTPTITPTPLAAPKIAVRAAATGQE